jgi:hypothetical protein
MELVGATAWAFDLAYDALTAEERVELERWLRAAGRTIIAQENVLTTTPNLVFCEHWRVEMIGYCLGDRELIEWALNDPGRHGPSRGGFYPVMDTMIRDEHFWAEAPIYALHYDVHGMFALAEAALRYDGTDLYKYVSQGMNYLVIRDDFEGFKERTPFFHYWSFSEDADAVPWRMRR